MTTRADSQRCSAKPCRAAGLYQADEPFRRTSGEHSCCRATGPREDARPVCDRARAGPARQRRHLRPGLRPRAAISAGERDLALESDSCSSTSKAYFARETNSSVSSSAAGAVADWRGIPWVGGGLLVRENDCFAQRAPTGSVATRGRRTYARTSVSVRHGVHRTLATSSRSKYIFSIVQRLQ